MNTSAIPQSDSNGVGPLDPFTFGEASLTFAQLFGTSTCGSVRFGLPEEPVLGLLHLRDQGLHRTSERVDQQLHHADDRFDGFGDAYQRD